MLTNYNNYPRDWKTRSKFVIIVRAKKQCEKCGAQLNKLHPMNGKKVKLSTAHLDHKTKDHSLLNLGCLCTICHLDFDKNDNLQRRKFKFHKVNQLKLALIGA